jgi:hypothetical protein
MCDEENSRIVGSLFGHAWALSYRSVMFCADGCKSVLFLGGSEQQLT